MESYIYRIPDLQIVSCRCMIGYMPSPSFHSPIDRKIPLLIIDKKGMLGSLIANKLREQNLIVLVSGKKFDVHSNIIHIPYNKKIPSIPENIYSHMIVFYNGEVEILDMLPALSKKANETHAKLLFVTQLGYSNERLIRFLNHHEFHSMQILFYGDIFDNALTVGNSISRFIEQIRSSKKLSIPEQGLGYIYPIHLDDVIDCIINTAFAKIHHKLLFLFPHVAFTQLSIARIFQKIDPLLKMDFTKNKHTDPDYYIPQSGTYYFAQYDLEEKLRSIKLDSDISPVSRRVRIKKRRTDQKLPLIFVFAFICFLILPLCLSLLAGLVGAITSSYALGLAQKGKLSQAVQYADFSQDSFNTSLALANSVVILDLIGQGSNYQQMESVHLHLAQTEYQILSALDILSGIYNGTSKNPSADFQTALTSLKNSFILIQKFQAEGQLPSQAMNKLQEIGVVSNLFENTSDALPYLLGFNGTRTYLILFQNNMEIRPGGGFIGSYAIAQLKNGSPISFVVSDVYDADGKMKIALAPPFALQRYLGATHWFLRDSNYDVDFERDGASATSLLQDETGQHVDGVIAIDTDFMKSIIGDFGQVYVPGYNMTVTPSNFYQITESQSEDGFFPGSRQKKAFLEALFDALILHMQVAKNIPVVSILQTIGDSVIQKHLLFTFSQPAVEKLFTVNDLSDSLWDDRTNDNNTFPDTLGVIDANLGANKANLYVKRTIEQMATFMQNGDLQEKVTVNYMNTSNSQSSFGGIYKDYVRFLVPGNATLQDVAIDGQIVQITPAITNPVVFTQPGFTPPSQLEIESSQQEGKTLYGLLLIVSQGSSKTVTITYTINHAVDMTQPAFTYDLRLFKQPGAQNDPYSLLVAYPNQFNPVITDSLTNVGGKLAYNSTLSKDEDMILEFSKK